MVSLAEWVSVCLQSKWLWFWVPLQSLKLQMSHLFRARISLKFMQLWVWIHSETRMWHDTVKCTIQISTHITPQSFGSWLNGWMFNYKLNVFGFESLYSHLFLILKNQRIWPIRIILLYRRIQDSFKCHFLFIVY